MVRYSWAAVVFAIVLSGLGIAAPAAAADPGLSAWNREFVRLVAGSHPQELVRADAWVALISEDGDAAVDEFVDVGLWDAVQRADEVGEQHADFARRVLATFTSEFSPEVHAAAQHALNGGDSDRAEFVLTGFAAAQNRDRQARAAEGSLARALVAEDRAFVRNLAATDPGAQVRASATWATRTGATDDDLVAFFADGWTHAAVLDLESHRRQEIESDARWRATVRRLLADAQEAEQAALGAAEEFREQARAAAARAWRTAGESTGPARTAWAGAEQIALQQAANWRAVAAAAAAATGPNWKPIAGVATRTQSSWTAEREWAAEQARAWNALLAKAIEGETRMTQPAR
ncbi:hypothetical protein JOF56_005869 [Kibdelosporangium banguiense]|uniref:Uncharacterized protein n=1 Tax=Kibdelosporangium banguiense TaxID=1365924 RepID=A0ABS4TMB0_9PSEU|nr:hypothetical protein [Kibdelosporangium banguiense]MBP2325484.1 hypothetical protein [Kibdelosporangium banguiense]